jgi:hypothetical protein
MVVPQFCFKEEQEKFRKPRKKNYETDMYVVLDNSNLTKRWDQSGDVANSDGWAGSQICACNHHELQHVLQPQN